ncbi:MAG: hypothetical protein IKP00_03570 [Victivallales bacterium]|nr:hypothetical protein [Victivallales bacterium]
MPQVTEEELGKLFSEQVERLQEGHFLVLYWAALGEGKKVKYNITNLFDDLKAVGITRTKQTVVGIVQGLESLCFVDLREERNRKNIYITRFGAKALEMMVKQKRYTSRKSAFLEAQEK